MESKKVLEIIIGQENKVRPIVANLFKSILGGDINIEFSQYLYSPYDMIIDTKDYILIVEVKERKCNSNTYDETALDERKVRALKAKKRSMSNKKPIYIIYSALFQDKKIIMYNLETAVDSNKFQFKRVRKTTADINSPMVIKKQYLLNPDKARVYELLG